LWEQKDEGEGISEREAQGKFCQEIVCFLIVSVWQKYIQKVAAPSQGSIL